MQFGKHWTSLDPRDIFLEAHSLYRKHVLRDGNCLFRVVAEAMYDTQKLHLEVRQECTRYMFLKRRQFQKYIKGDYDDYLRRMSLPRKQGTLVELSAMCYMYRRNLNIYESGKLAKRAVFSSDFTKYISVFHAPGNHFDLILSRNEYNAAAVAQSITYTLLYKDVFKLPDIENAVDKMLYTKKDKDGEQTPTGFQLDYPENTQCLLLNPELCSFHNFSGDNVSCVLQYLHSGPLPFPYRVAKSLDPFVYRNVDIDLACTYYKGRRVFRMRNESVYNLDFKVGDKCRFEQWDFQFEGYIQHIDKKSLKCIVYVIEVGEKWLLSLNQLQLLPLTYNPYHSQQGKEKSEGNFNTQCDQLNGMTNCIGPVQVSTTVQTPNVVNCSQYVQDQFGHFQQSNTVYYNPYDFYTQPLLMTSPYMQIQLQQQQQQMPFWNPYNQFPTVQYPVNNQADQ